jgi:hypothetical protein
VSKPEADVVAALVELFVEDFGRAPTKQELLDYMEEGWGALFAQGGKS